jgi:hypothetical protein
MKQGLDVLRMLFYANLLRGEHDALEIVEIERKNDGKMEMELIKRRQRRNDDDGDNVDEDLNEQQPIGESTSEASTFSAAADDQSSNTRIRASTNENDEIQSPYENALQMKLGLKLNEYRHGQYPFDEFVNEFANEKIEIKEEYLNFIQTSTSTIRFSFIFYPFFLSTINKIGNFIQILFS